MNKVYYFLLTGCMIVFLFIYLNNSKDNLKLCSNYLKDKGYEIISKDGKIETYQLTQKKLLETPYSIIWGLQTADAKNYIGKTVEVYRFVIKNHILDLNINNSNRQTMMWVMVVNNKIIGGYSSPNINIFGSVYSLDGKTLEQVTGLTLEEWTKVWKDKFVK